MLETEALHFSCKPTPQRFTSKPVSPMLKLQRVESITPKHLLGELEVPIINLQNCVSGYSYHLEDDR